MKKWISYNKNYSDIDNFIKEFKISDTLARLLINRDIDSIEKAKKYLNPDISQLHNPFEMLDMHKSINRIVKAVMEKEKICIYGDYDVDGITSVAMLYNFIKKLEGNIIYYIPSRLEEGYGLNTEAIKKIIDYNVNLIITVDCGIRSVDEVRLANDSGIDVIITDHHRCGDTLPEAYAIINPNQKQCKYPFKDLSGAGIVFKIITALSEKLSYKGYALNYLDLTALATVADVVALTGENRVIVKKGIEQLKVTINQGLKALIDVCDIKLTDLDTYHLGFIIAPRINAAGRLKNASRVVELLTTTDEAKAYKIAKELNELNYNRQHIESKMLETALEKINKERDIETENIIVLDDTSWHIGVIGIIASRITEKFNKPSIIISTESEIGKGSARSVKGLNIHEVLSTCEELLIKFGGHELAAGLTIKKELIDDFRKKINNAVNKLKKGEPFYREILVDYKLDNDDNLFSAFNEIKRLEPFGAGNPKPLFVYRGLILKDIKTVGMDGKHLSLNMYNGKEYIRGIGFNMGFIANHIEVNQKIDIICSVEINSWNGEESIQLHIKDLKTSKYK